MPNSDKDIPRVYWDACVLLHYIEGTPDRVETIASLLDAAERGEAIVYTSQLSIAEVAFGKEKKEGKALDPDVEERINKLWHPQSPVKLVEVHQLVAYEARSLMRQFLPRGWSLKPPDAIHFATAKELKVSEFFTYDDKLFRYSDELGFKVCAPYAKQLQLLFTSGNALQPPPVVPEPDSPQVDGDWLWRVSHKRYLTSRDPSRFGPQKSLQK
jgi:predicted nucleic acid-binding protein